METVREQIQTMALTFGDGRYPEHTRAVRAREGRGTEHVRNRTSEIVCPSGSRWSWQKVEAQATRVTGGAAAGRDRADKA
jgi:hypothetical protein